MEIVYAENYRIKRIFSLPLGARRLTDEYSDSDFTFRRKKFEQMEERIRDLLPSSKNLKISKEAKLVGVGGTLRALVRYHQKVAGYPLKKIHNYSMEYDSVDYLCTRLSEFSKSEMRELGVFSSARSETMVAGACVIRAIMEKLELSEIFASLQGLREGTLSVFLNSPRTFHSGKVDKKEIEKQIRQATSPPSGHWADQIGRPSSVGLIDRRERDILLSKAELLRDVMPTANLDSFFSQLINLDSYLQHEDQLLLSLALVYSRNQRTGLELAQGYRPILGKRAKREVKKLAAFDKLFELLQETSSRIRSENQLKVLRIQMPALKSRLPTGLMRSVADAIDDAIGVRVVYSSEKGNHSGQKIIKLDEAEQIETGR